jgi:hypothetical protein
VIDLAAAADKADVLDGDQAGMAYILVVVDEFEEGIIFGVRELILFQNVPVFELVPAIERGMLIYFKLTLRILTNLDI